METIKGNLGGNPLEEVKKKNFSVLKRREQGAPSVIKKKLEHKQYGKCHDLALGSQPRQGAWKGEG